MKLQKFIKTTMREYLNEQILKESMRDNLQKVVFSKEFFEQKEDMIKYQTKLYLDKIKSFIDFYKKYNPKGIRVINGIDYYEESKKIYDKIINGEVFIDEVFKNPDNPLRNIVMLLHIDEPALKRKLNENFKLIKEDKNFIYTETDYERYLSLEKNILKKINEISPNDIFFASTWYRRSHENDKDLIFQEMHFPTKSDSSVKKIPFNKSEKETITNIINQIISKYNIENVNILFDNKFREITLENFKDNKIKKADKGRNSFEYPINGRVIKFIISDRDLVSFVGKTSLKSIFDIDKTFDLDNSFKVVSYLSSHLNKFIKIYDEIYNLNDVENAYVKFFHDTLGDGEVITPNAVLYKKYILNDLKIYNNKDVVDLFDMLETINYTFAYYDSLNKLSGKHYVRNL